MQDVGTVVIAVLTFRRPEALAVILSALAAQVETVPHEVDILVVDNDPHGSARHFVEGQPQDIPVRYVHEPSPGISAARNRALDHSSDCDILIFIDDDEKPSDRWLQTLIDAFAKHDCVAVAGRVVSEFEPGVEPDAWVLEGRAFLRGERSSGTLMPVAASNNLLVELPFLRRHELRFDERFGLSGGSDTLITRQMTDLGGRIVWCNEAVVVDMVPRERATREWVLRRAYRQGNTATRVALAVESTPGGRMRARLGMTAQGSARVLSGGLRSAVGVLVGGLRQVTPGMKTVARGAGMVAGAFGSNYSEYSRT